MNIGTFRQFMLSLLPRTSTLLKRRLLRMPRPAPDGVSGAKARSTALPQWRSEIHTYDESLDTFFPCPEHNHVMNRRYRKSRRDSGRTRAMATDRVWAAAPPPSESYQTPYERESAATDGQLASNERRQCAVRLPHAPRHDQTAVHDPSNSLYRPTHSRPLHVKTARQCGGCRC